jgi:hypothetical protein
VWVIDTSQNPMEKARPRAIPVPWLANRTVLAMKVATDNQRVALITSNRAGGDVQVVVTGIARSSSGAPVALAAEPLRVGWTLTAATDLAWVDDSTLAVVGRVSPRDAIGPQLVEIGGKITPMPRVAGTRLVTNTGGLRGVVVLTDWGKILARAGNGWQVLQTGTDFLTPGEYSGPVRGRGCRAPARCGQPWLGRTTVTRRLRARPASLVLGAMGSA